MANALASNRVVIGDINTGPYRMALAKFREAGWDVAAYANFKDLIQDITMNPPRLLVTNLMLYNGSGLRLLDYVKESERFRETKVLVVSSFASKENVHECFRRGACDFIVTPFPPENLYRRLIYHLQDKREFGDQEVQPIAGRVRASEPSTDHRHALGVIIETLNLVTTEEEPHKTLFQITKKMEEIAPINRCSFIVSEPGGAHGIVVASNDDPGVTDLALDMSKYPEVSHVMNTGLVVIVDDIMKNPLTQSIQQNVKSIRICNIMVLPVRMHGDCIGVISLRSEQFANPFSLEVARICQAICNASAPVVKVLRDMKLGGTILGPNRKIS